MRRMPVVSRVKSSVLKRKANESCELRGDDLSSGDFIGSYGSWPFVSVPVESNVRRVGYQIEGECATTPGSPGSVPWQRGDQVISRLHRYRACGQDTRKPDGCTCSAWSECGDQHGPSSGSADEPTNALPTGPAGLGMLETLQVRQIINRHCPTGSRVGQRGGGLGPGAESLELPLALVKTGDWVGQTCWRRNWASRQVQR